MVLTTHEFCQSRGGLLGGQGTRPRSGLFGLFGLFVDDEKNVVVVSLRSDGSMANRLGMAAADGNADDIAG